MAAAGGTLSTGHHSRYVQLLCCSPALHGALLSVAIALPRGSAQSRESLTQDSRSAVKARLFDPLRESFGEERCTPREDGVMAFKRPSRGSEPSVMRRDALETRADRGMRAYVTGGWLPQWTTRAGQQVHVRYDITPRRMASSWLAAQAERRSCAACTAQSRHLRGGARMKAGDACVVLQVPAA